MKDFNEDEITELYKGFGQNHDEQRGGMLQRLQQQPVALGTNKMLRRIVLLVGSTVVAAIVVAIFALASSEVSYADVMENVAKQLWVHEKYDDGQESWTCSKKGLSFYKDATGGVKFFDGKTFLFIQYWPGQDHITETRPTPEQLEQLKNPKPVETAETQEAVEDSTDSDDDLGELKAVKDIVKGRELLRYDLFHTDALDKRHLRSQLWVDPKTNLPVRSRRWITSIDAGVVSRQFLDGTFFFQKKGRPTSMRSAFPEDYELFRAISRRHCRNYPRSWWKSSRARREHGLDFRNGFVFSIGRISMKKIGTGVWTLNVFIGMETLDGRTSLDFFPTSPTGEMFVCIRRRIGLASI